MALNIKSAEADRLARELAARTGESITEAVTKALRERLDRAAPARNQALRAVLEGVWERMSKLPVLDHRSDDEIIGYNEYGAFD
jgi:antitoxin VapB